MGQFEWISLKFMPSLVLYVGTDTNGYLSGCATLTDYQCDFPDGQTRTIIGKMKLGGAVKKDKKNKKICIITDALYKRHHFHHLNYLHCFHHFYQPSDALMHYMHAVRTYVITIIENLAQPNSFITNCFKL